jgi:hypothetical protein
MSSPIPSSTFATNRQRAAYRQIAGAIEHFHRQEIECAITLASAAEGILPQVVEPHLFKQLRGHPSGQEIDYNLVTNWLKHCNPPDTVNISEFEAVVILLRAITKLIAVYKMSSQRMEDFIEWSRDNGYPTPARQIR